MSLNLIKDIQSHHDLRLIMPFGLELSLGDVVNVNRDGSFTLEGTSRSLLALPVDAHNVRAEQDAGVNMALDGRARHRSSLEFCTSNLALNWQGTTQHPQTFFP
jgi:hypothetical protein